MGYKVEIHMSTMYNNMYILRLIMLSFQSMPHWFRLKTNKKKLAFLGEEQWLNVTIWLSIATEEVGIQETVGF